MKKRARLPYSCRKCSAVISRDLKTPSRTHLLRPGARDVYAEVRGRRRLDRDHDRFPHAPPQGDRSRKRYGRRNARAGGGRGPRRAARDPHPQGHEGHADRVPRGLAAVPRAPGRRRPPPDRPRGPLRRDPRPRRHADRRPRRRQGRRPRARRVALPSCPSSPNPPATPGPSPPPPSPASSSAAPARNPPTRPRSRSPSPPSQTRTAPASPPSRSPAPSPWTRARTSACSST